jgi:hypothetical protein
MMPVMIDGTPTQLRDALARILVEEQVLHRVIDLVRYAADASPYRLVPQVVVLPRSTADSPMSLLTVDRQVDFPRSAYETELSIPVR